MQSTRTLGVDLLRKSRQYELRSWSIAAWQLASTIGLALVIGGAIVAAAKSFAVLLIVLIPAAAGVLLRLFMIQHDCSHNSFCPSEGANVTLGRILGVLTLTPFDAWRANHAYHHASPGHLGRRGVGDISTLTVDEYADLSTGKRLLYRIYRQPLFLFPIGAPFAFFVLYRLPSCAIEGGGRAKASVAFTNIAVFALWTTCVYSGGLVLISYVLSIALAASLGAWFFFVQHQFEGTYWAAAPHWNFLEGSLLGSSHLELPNWANWITGDIALHHIHHLNPRIPNYRLRPMLEANEALSQWPRLSWRDALAAVHLALWDPKQKRLVPFRTAFGSQLAGPRGASIPPQSPSR